MTSTFLTGPAGTGKTTYTVERLAEMLRQGVPANTILVLVPQLPLAQPYRELLQQVELPGASQVEIMTMNGLAIQIIDLFWPLLATGSLKFGRPQARPVFLNVEATQYYLQQAIEPLLEQGYFDPNVVPVTIPWPRLMLQILDNLNKAAILGIPHTEVGQRLALSLAPEAGQRVALEHAQICLNRFREFCLERNLLDFSLRVETFYQHLWPVSGVRQFIFNRYRHLIVDNLEEDTSFSHAVLREWLPQTTSALLVYDEEAGFRSLLGANWRTAQALAEVADETLRFDEARVAPAPMLQLGERLSQILMGERADKLPPVSPDAPLPFTFEQRRFSPQMVQWVAERVARLVEEGTSPNQIVILAPTVSDALHFSLANRLEQRGLTVHSHRPSQPISEEPVIKTMLTLARLAFSHWNMLPEAADVAQALSQVIEGLDWVRADLLTQVVYRQYEREQGVLSAFSQIEGPIRWRISEPVGEQFDRLRLWLQEVRGLATPPTMDEFFSRLFEEILSQPGFGFYEQPEAARWVANLIDSARRFREVAAQVPVDVQYQSGNRELQAVFPEVDQVNRGYLEMMAQDIVAAQYLRSWEPAPENAISIMPATTFVISNRFVDYQFWLDAGSSGWWERIAQPLTHPYILMAGWEPGQPWTDLDEAAAQHEWLSRMILGLTRRCRRHIFVAHAEIGEQGYEQRGPLLTVLHRLLRQRQMAAAAG